MSILFRQEPRQARRLQLADALTRAGLSASPVQHPMQAVARVAQAWAGRNIRDKAEREAEERRKNTLRTLTDAFGGGLVEEQKPLDMSGTVEGEGGFTGVIDRKRDQSPIRKSPDRRMNLARALMGNPETADYGAQMAMQLTMERPKDNTPIKVGSSLVDPITLKPIYVDPVRTSPVEAPSSVREWEYYNALSPDDRERYLTMKRAAIFKDFGPGFARMPQTGQFEPQVVLEKDLAPGERPEVKGAQVAAQEKARADIKKELGEPKRKSSIAGQTAKVNMMDNLIDEAKNMSSAWTTGFVGSMMAGVPGTEAHDLAKKLETIRANIGFDRLQEMRESSPTGGALGQVSEMENRLLQAVWGNLEQSQSKEQFEKNLDLVKKQVRDSWRRVADAYEMDYGVPYEGEIPELGEGRRENDPLGIRGF